MPDQHGRFRNPTAKLIFALTLAAVAAAALTSQARPAGAQAYKPLFYDNDFSNLTDPGYTDWHLGNRLKRVRPGRSVVCDFGGQLRTRHHSERGIRRGLAGGDDDFLLYRTRLFANVEVGEGLRAYAEMLDAVSNYEDLPPRVIEENRTDLQNLFGDVRVFNPRRGELWLRLGRQELLYGAERTVSPLDWANTRRTFEGYKAFWAGEQWDVDAFYVRPMRINPRRFDSPNFDQEFMGVYSKYRGLEKTGVELYYLRLTNEAAPFDFDTLGTRLDGELGRWLWEVEAAVQWGAFQGSDHTAGAWTLGLGRKLEDLPWNPTLWAYYDWASGSDEIGNGYHHLFPLSHKYLGFMDLFGRRNIESPNVRLTLAPHKRLKLLLWYYVFYLERRTDVPYSLAMTPFNAANPPASAYLGQEIDLTANWRMTDRMSLLFGYSHFFAGDYFEDTPGVADRGDRDFFYTQYTVDF